MVLFIRDVQLGSQVNALVVLLLEHFLDPVDLTLANVHLGLILLNLSLRLLVDLLLRVCNIIKLGAHVLDLLSLGGVDVGLA